MRSAKAGTTAPVTPRDVKAQAVARVIARPRPARYATYHDPHSDGKVRIQLEGGPGEFAEARTVAEWADDRLARSTPGTPVTDLLIEMFERIRVDGPGAVPAVIGLAAGLSDSAQFAVFMCLNAVPAGPGGIGSALLREWTRRGLRVMPGAPVQLETTDWNSPSQAARRVRYRSDLGQPAGMTA